MTGGQISRYAPLVGKVAFDLLSVGLDKCAADNQKLAHAAQQGDGFGYLVSYN